MLEMGKRSNGTLTSSQNGEQQNNVTVLSHSKLCPWEIFITTPSQSLHATQNETMGVESLSLEPHKQAPLVGQETQGCC